MSLTTKEGQEKLENALSISGLRPLNKSEIDHLQYVSDKAKSIIALLKGMTIVEAKSILELTTAEISQLSIV